MVSGGETPSSVRPESAADDARQAAQDSGTPRFESAVSRTSRRHRSKRRTSRRSSKGSPASAEFGGPGKQAQFQVLSGGGSHAARILAPEANASESQWRAPRQWYPGQGHQAH
ncbi:uncharacterized protein LOC144123649 [Amblyomma americanum]